MTDSNDDTEPGKDAGEAAEAQNKAEESPEPKPETKRGSVRYQDAETTTPREPTLAEKRAMRRALEEEEEREKTAVIETEAAEKKAITRRRLMIGAGVTVGVVATVALWYSATPDEVTASCVDNSNALSTDENICTEEYVTSHGGYSSGGIFFMPLVGGGYQQYHYNYGGTVSNGRVSGGTTAAPSSRTTVKSATSGKTVQRGGFGVSGGGKSGGS